MERDIIDWGERKGRDTSDPGYTQPSVTAQPAQHIPLAVESPVSCTSCGETGITFPHSCYPVSDITKPKLNRFCPFEALDDILQRLGELVADYISGGCRNTDEIGNQVNALRAYITGMER